MLGKNIKVVIDGSAYDKRFRFCSPLYKAHVIAPLPGIYNRTVYVISNKPIDTVFNGTVIAVVRSNLSQREQLIIAPPEMIYYAPEIRNCLSRIHNYGAFKLICLYEKSCGAVIFHDSPDERYFLLVKNNNGRYWGFPKGHIEVGETEEQTAIREVKEETGLDVTILDGFRKTSVYRLVGQVRKKVVIFLAKSDSQQVTIQNSEIANYKWLKEDETCQVLRHRNDARIFDAALKWLEKAPESLS